ncbi:hypothetical protein ABZ442_11725 [Streptomyces triculaminicus]|uniref:hypothetical protein n=1 Tax=Streptomyces triculaminicus TaxID=2816232 RepID=UPI0033C0574B
MRKAVQITGAAIFAAVLMTGCGSSGGEKDKETGQPAPTGASKPADAPKDKPAETPAKQVTATDLAGGWSNGGKLADKSIVVLTFADKIVAISGKSTCTGELVDNAQPVTINVKHCQDGAKDYTTGTIKDFTGKSFTVAWASGKEEKYNKALSADGKPAGVGIPGLPAKPGS